VPVPDDADRLPRVPTAWKLNCDQIGSPPTDPDQVPLPWFCRAAKCSGPSPSDQTNVTESIVDGLTVTVTVAVAVLPAQPLSAAPTVGTPTTSGGGDGDREGDGLGEGDGERDGDGLTAAGTMGRGRRRDALGEGTTDGDGSTDGDAAGLGSTGAAVTGSGAALV
jgi:hypothetical protein